MTKQEFDEMAALVVRLRKELEHTNQHLVAHIDALTKSNAQCGEYLRRNEQLQADVVELTTGLKHVSALVASGDTERDKLQAAKDEMQNALAEATKDLSYSRLAVDTMRARDMRFTETIAKCGAAAGEDIGDFIERTAAERHKLHSELVDARAALAATTEQRDSLKRTLDEWERADTKPHARIDEVAQVVPVCMQCLKDRIETAHAYETGPSVAILTKPLLPDDVADHVVPPVLPLCNACHGCGMPLGASAKGPYLWCTNFSCNRKTTQYQDHDASPYWGPCKSATPVRHE